MPRCAERKRREKKKEKVFQRASAQQASNGRQVSRAQIYDLKVHDREPSVHRVNKGAELADVNLHRSFAANSQPVEPRVLRAT
jgi:hypothetical protein